MNHKSLPLFTCDPVWRLVLHFQSGRRLIELSNWHPMNLSTGHTDRLKLNEPPMLSLVWNPPGCPWPFTTPLPGCHCVQLIPFCGVPRSLIAALCSVTPSSSTIKTLLLNNKMGTDNIRNEITRRIRAGWVCGVSDNTTDLVNWNIRHGINIIPPQSFLGEPNTKTTWEMKGYKNLSRDI